MKTTGRHDWYSNNIGQRPECGYIRDEGFRDQPGIRPDGVDEERDQLREVPPQPRELPRRGEHLLLAGEDVRQVAGTVIL